MDLDYLYRRRDLSLLMATNAACEEARLVHRELAERYGSLIAAARSRLEVAGAA